MPRRTRMHLPGHPRHIVQRGNNREPCCFEPENFRYYLELWKGNARRYGVAVHTYSPMTNQIHFRVTPEHAESVSRATRVIGSRYAWYLNSSYERTGTVWERRHKSSLVQTGHYFRTCCRHIEMNPVVAAMVVKPGEYRWSTCRANIWSAQSGPTQRDEYLNRGENTEGGSIRIENCSDMRLPMRIYKSSSAQAILPSDRR